MLTWLAKVIPDHGFHPAVNHFPIALFLFGAALDFLGACRKDAAIRRMAFWNLAAGSISTIVVIPTGVAAYFLSDYTWNGMVIVHITAAACAIVLMALVALWRRKGTHTSRAYFSLLSLAAIALGVAGYYGGELIYGL